MSFDKGLCLYLSNSNTIELWNISITPEISLMLEGICEGTLKGLFYCSGGWWEGGQPIGKGMSPWNQADLGKVLSKPSNEVPGNRTLPEPFAYWWSGKRPLEYTVAS